MHIFANPVTYANNSVMYVCRNMYVTTYVCMYVRTYVMKQISTITLDSAGRYTGICSYSRYVSNTGYHGYHSIYTGIFL